MAQKETIILIVLLCCLAVHATTPGSATAQGGNITPINLHHTRETTIWHGLVGNLIIAGPNQTNITAIGGEINQTDIVIASACASPTINGTILFSNSSATPTLLTAGNLSQLDAFLNFPTETGTETFPNTSTFIIGGIPITNVPTTNTYVNSNPQSIVFREGYLNDASGNIIFAVAINLNTIGYNGTIYDYQAILALADNMTTPYYITTDLTVTCPGATTGSGGGRGGRGYVNALVLRVPEIQMPEFLDVTEEMVQQIENLDQLQILAPKEVNAMIGETLAVPVTVINPNTETAPLVTVVLRLPTILQPITDLHQNPLLYSLFGFSTIHGSTQTVHFTPLNVEFHEVAKGQQITFDLANDIPLTRPTDLQGTIEVYAGNNPLGSTPITVHLIAPPIAVQTHRDGREIEVTVLVNNENNAARKTNLELNYNTGRTTHAADFFVLPLAANTVELYGYTYKPAIQFEHTTARTPLGFAED